MANTMKAAVVRTFGQQLTIEDVPIPTPGPGEVLVKIVATGVCHTDLHAADGDWPVRPAPPFIPGHEGPAAGLSVLAKNRRLAWVPLYRRRGAVVAVDDGHGMKPQQRRLIGQVRRRAVLVEMQVAGCGLSRPSQMA
jgi:alcohol dehydrogenase-like protein